MGSKGARNVMRSVSQVFKSLLPHRFREPPLIGEAWNVDDELNNFAPGMAPPSAQKTLRWASSDTSTRP